MRRQLGVSGAGLWQWLWIGRSEGMAAVKVSGSRCGWRALCLLVTALCVVHHASAVEVYVPEEVSVENGTHAKLSCTFKSTELTVTKLSATWSYTGEASGSKKITIFLYTSGTPYPGTDSHFKDRITWAGDLNKRDVSIKIDKINFKDNGTYSCHVHNPPDIVGYDKGIKLRVVEKGNLPVSNVPFLVGIICAAIGGILLITIIVSAVVITKKKRSRKDYSGHDLGSRRWIMMI
ncbi:myelin protein zero-like protein 1 isoform X2 [Pseudophryne corroboree]|uniref:myelin protein zero-like protein 1 isoform X2 n=1 Tax=Pseudophryne corroboree TaxID=495146 RepID=UPI0030816FAF